MQLLIISLLLIFSFYAQAAMYSISPKDGEVNFLAKGKPALISIKGKGDGVSGKLEIKDSTLTGEINFDLTTLNTGIDLRDDHLKNRYVEVGKFPMAKLNLKNQSYNNTNEPFKFSGTLMLHGIEQPVEGVAMIANDSSLEANFKIELSKFKIEIPSFQGITVSEDVAITVKSKIIIAE